MAAYHATENAVALNLQAAVAVAAEDDGVVGVHLGRGVMLTILSTLHVLPALGAHEAFDDDCDVILPCCDEALSC